MADAKSRPHTAAIRSKPHQPASLAPTPAPTAELPRVCTSDAKDCYLPDDFVQLLCQKKYPGVAIRLFERTAPWQRGYVKVKDVAAVNMYGGPVAATRLEFLEEVVLLRQRPVGRRERLADMPQNYDVLRFDGTCATLAQDEFMTKKPVLPPRYAPFVWSQIDPALRRVLSEDPKVEKARSSQTELCHGSVLTGGSGACKDATQLLARAILNAAGTSAVLPLPEELPHWPNTEATARIDRAMR